MQMSVPIWVSHIVIPVQLHLRIPIEYIDTAALFTKIESLGVRNV